MRRSSSPCVSGPCWQEVVGQERLLAFLLLGRADDVVEDAGVVVDVAEVDVVGELLLIHQRLALILHPLPRDEAAERDQPAHRRKCAFHLVVLDRGRDAEIESEHQEQHRHRRSEVEQDRDAADERGHAEEQFVQRAHHDLHVRKQGVEVRACDVAEILDQHRPRSDAPLQRPPALVDGARVLLQRDEQNDVVVDRRIDCLRSPAVPARDVEALAVLAAAEEAHVAEILERRPDLDLHFDALAMRALDLLVRHFDEIGALEHGGEQLEELRIGLVDRSGCELRVNG